MSVIDEEVKVDMERKHNKGFTMAEMLIVVGIIIVLFGLAFLAVQNHWRSLTKKEYDEYAREIFVAAQNNLSMASHEVYLGFDDADQYGTKEPVLAGVDGSGDGIYYFKVHVEGGNEFKGSLTDQDQSVLDLMLPFGSIDDTIRMGGCYIIRYHKDSGQVLDVFYWKQTAKRYAHTYSNADYENFLKQKNDIDALRNYGAKKSVIGYYGGVEAKGLTRGRELESPLLIVKNAEKLTATVKLRELFGDNEYLKLLITGLTSGKSQEINILKTDLTIAEGETLYSHTIVLDDVTTVQSHFYDKYCTGKFNGAGESVNLIPGENIVLQAVLYNNSELTNIGRSASQKTNSLYGDLEINPGTTTQDTAIIKNFRHLENLGNNISNVDNVLHGKKGDEPAIQILNAKQTTDLDWVKFRAAIGGDKIKVFGHLDSVGTADNTYLPIEPSYALKYEGQNFGISKVVIDTAETNAGLIREQSMANYGAVSNLKLIDFSVNSTLDNGTAGCLAGTYSGVIKNVIAYELDDAVTSKGVTAKGSAGGLVGELISGKIEESGAAVYVKSTAGAAGGLIGAANGGEINYSFSGGHTKNGEYLPKINPADSYDVTGVTAGGLIGSFCDPARFSTIADTKNIKGCYSTCSVSGTSAGGFVGSINGNVINCYCTGYVKPDETEKEPDVATIHAFAGTTASGGTVPAFIGNNSYLMSINEIKVLDNKGNIKEIKYMEPYTTSGAFYQIDQTAESYNDFVGEWSTWSPALPYDDELMTYYSGKYTLKTVNELYNNAGGDVDVDIPAEYFVRTHYGDWPSPEVFFINTPTS